MNSAACVIPPAPLFYYNLQMAPSNIYTMKDTRYSSVNTYQSAMSSVQQPHSVTELSTLEGGNAAHFVSSI